MSITLPATDLSAATVGSTGSISLASVNGGGGVPAIPGGKLPTIRLHNDSGAGVSITLPASGTAFNLPAGGWVDCQPLPGETSVDYTVLYLLPNPPVSLLLATYYYPNEPVPAMTILGNSPVGVGGTISTSNTSIVNDGNAPGTSIIEATPSDAASSTWKADNSGNLTVKGDNAGTLTTLLQLIAGASPAVKLAAAAILTEVLGNLQVDGTTTLNNLSGKSGQNFLIAVPSSEQFQVEIGGTVYLALTTGNFHIDNVGCVCANLQLPVGQINAFTTGTVSISGGGTSTISHGLGRTPQAVLVTTDETGGTATNAAYSYTSTQFTLRNGDGGNTHTFRWVAIG